MFLFCGFIMCISKGQNVINTKTDDKTIREKNKSIVMEVFSEVVNKRNISVIDKLYDQKMVDHGAWEGQAPGIEGFRKTAQEFISGFLSNR